MIPRKHSIAPLSLYHRVIFMLMAFSACLPTGVFAQAQTGTITGRVLNQGTQEYLRNALVRVAGTQISTTAEAGGNYTLINVPVGSVKLTVSYAGLDTQDVPVTVVAGQTVVADVTLTSADYKSDVIELGVFVVASEREGNAKAIMEQKASIEAKKVLATDTFGSISEGNVGEFLKYLPGVQIDYTEADARSVSLSGLDPKYTAITMDGAPIASSGLGAASGTGASRAFEFEQISINSIETVELYRTPQPENPGSALAGVVNLRSKGAFDRAGRSIKLNVGAALNSMSGNPFEKHPGWDDESHYRVQPNWGLEYSDVFLNRKLGVLAGYNYSYTFSEQKAQTIFYAYDTDPSNNATETPRLTNVNFRDSPKPTIRYNGNVRVDYKFSPNLWVSTRAEYNKYHAKFFSRDVNFNFLTTANSPDPDGAGAGVAGPVVPGAQYSLNSQTAPTASVSINQGGGGTNKYGETSNFGVAAYYKRGPLRVDVAGNYSRSQTWYKDRQFGFFWSINPGTLTGLGLRFNRQGSADPAITITQTSGPDYKNLANHPNGFSATTNDRRAEDQRYLFRVDSQYDASVWGIPTIFKGGVHIAEQINNVDRPINNRTYTRRGADNVAATADENLSLWAEPAYRMNFDYGGNVDGLTNLDRWALYKDFQAHPEWWTAPTAGQLLQDSLQQARDAKEQIDAVYFQANSKLFNKLNIAPGVRWEKTRGTAIGPADLGDRETRRRMTGSTTGAVDAAGVDYIQTRYGSGRSSSQQDYDTWLRYLHTSYRFTDDLVLKSSYNQSISRPDMNWTVGGLIVTNDDPTDPNPNRATAGNEALQPERSKTLNVTLEYYTRGIGTMSVSGFRRDFTNFIRELDIALPSGGTWNGEPLPSSVSNEPWIIRTRDNVAKSHLTSVEFSVIRKLDFLPGPLGDITVNTNYTNIRYDRYDNFLRAQNVANLGWTIPYRALTLRWNSNWREGHRREITAPVTTNIPGIVGLLPSAAATAGYPLYLRESFTHTLDFSWEFRRNTIFYVTARNIFNQDQGEYRGRSDLRTRWVQTGAIWTTGVTARF